MAINRYYVTCVAQVIQFIVSNEMESRGSWDKFEHCDTALFMNLFNYTLKIYPKLADIYKTIIENAF